MALTIEQKRAAAKFLHPTAGFMIDEATGRFLKWHGPGRNPPTDADLEQAHADMLEAQHREQLKAEARRVAIDRIAEDVLADIDAGAVKDVEAVRGSPKFRIPPRGGG